MCRGLGANLTAKFVGSLENSLETAIFRGALKWWREGKVLRECSKISANFVVLEGLMSKK
jgi:hypothetical protein